MIRTVISSTRLANSLLRSAATATRKQQSDPTQYRHYGFFSGTTLNFPESPQFDIESFHKEIAEAHTHNPIEGFIRTSPFEPCVVPEMPLDQYVWQHLPKWSNHIAAVSFTLIVLCKRVRVNGALTAPFANQSNDPMRARVRAFMHSWRCRWRAARLCQRLRVAQRHLFSLQFDTQMIYCDEVWIILKLSSITTTSNRSEAIYHHRKSSTNFE